MIMNWSLEKCAAICIMGNTKMKIHFSFDLDGTLIDSIPLMKSSWENCNNLLSLNIPWVAYRSQIGLPFLEICKNLGIENYYNSVRNEYFGFNKENIDKIAAMSGLNNLISVIEEKNISWSIITSKPSVTTLPILKELGLSPDIIITSDDVVRGKPNIDAANLLMSKIVADKVYYFGDAMVDHLFSINSGFEFVRCEFSSDELLVDDKCAYNYIKNPHLVVHGLDEVAEFISGFTPNYESN